MADGLFNIAKGGFIEKVRDSTTAVLVMALEANETETTLIDYDDIAALLVPAGNTEATATNYARKTGLTGTITVDDTNDRVDLDIPDQTWSSVSGTAFTKLVVGYEDAAADATRVPGSHHDFAVTPNGGDITAQMNASGVQRHS